MASGIGEHAVGVMRQPLGTVGSESGPAGCQGTSSSDHARAGNVDRDTHRRSEAGGGHQRPADLPAKTGRDRRAASEHAQRPECGFTAMLQGRTELARFCTPTCQRSQKPATAAARPS